MSFQVNRFNWVRTLTAWESMQAWRERHSAATQKFLSATADSNAALANAQVNLASGMATISAQIAVQRVQRENQAKTNSLSSQLNLTA